MLCLHWWLVILIWSECTEVHFYVCCKQAGIQTVSQEAVEQFCMDLSWQEEKPRQQCKKIESGSVPAKTFFFTSRTGLHTVCIPLIYVTQNILTGLMILIIFPYWSRQIWFLLHLEMEMVVDPTWLHDVDLAHRRRPLQHFFTRFSKVFYWSGFLVFFKFKSSSLVKKEKKNCILKE